MPRPCAKAHPPSPDECHLCKLVATDPAFAALWGARPARACPHRGQALEPVQCPSCSGTVRLKTWACALRGRCHQAAGRRVAGVQGCHDCPDRPRRVACTAFGVGDAVLALVATEGADYAVRPWQLPWAALFGGYRGLEVYAGPEAGDLVPHTPAAERARGRPRWQCYAEACGVRPRLPPVRPLPPEALAWAAPYRGSVVLAPWTGDDPGRHWPAGRWAELARLLAAAGRRVVVIDRAGRADRCAGIEAEPVLGEAAPRVAALMLQGALVVGVDSGMAHVAGMLGCDVLALCQHHPGEMIYGFYPRAGVMQCVLADLPAADVAERALAVIGRRAEALRAEAPDDRGRGPTTAHFLALALAAAGGSGPLVMETGCQRAEWDPGAGMSTTAFGRWLAPFGGRLISVDNDPAHAALARRLTAGLPVEVVEADSAAWLSAYAGPPPAGLYLDSLDADRPGHAEHCLAEARAALPHLLPGAPVLIDDAPGGGTGKGALAVPWLLARGWRVARQGYQTLLVRQGS